MSSENQAAAMPLVERLRSVPREWRELREIGPTHHRNVPYGVFCHEAADELARLRAALAAVHKAMGRK